MLQPRALAICLPVLCEATPHFGIARTCWEKLQ